MTNFHINRAEMGSFEIFSSKHGHSVRWSPCITAKKKWAKCDILQIEGVVAF